MVPSGTENSKIRKLPKTTYDDAVNISFEKLDLHQWPGCKLFLKSFAAHFIIDRSSQMKKDGSGWWVDSPTPTQ
jgi:hypothetical protein